MMEARPTSTVLVRLTGGLGNQLFQAAAGLALARRRNARLAVDLSPYYRHGLREYELGPLPIDAEIWPDPRPGPREKLLAVLDQWRGRPRVKRPRRWRGKVFQEPHFHYAPAFEHLEGDVFLSGYFQSVRYFAGYETLVRESFDASAGIPDDVRDLATRLEGDLSVAVHIRRGDYANNPDTLSVHGLMDERYYDPAIAHVRAQVPDARLFVFSDDPDFAQARASEWGATVMSGGSALGDMWLMSRCRHHIIANSSFSWWSAFLDGREGSLVVAPKQWFAPAKMAQTNTEDLYCPGWTVI